MLNRRFPLTSAALLLACSLSACSLLPDRHSGAADSSSAMPDETQTWCFGRHLVDVPASAQLWGFGNEYQGVFIRSGGEDKDLIATMDGVIEEQKSGYKRIDEGRIDAFTWLPKPGSDDRVYYYLSGHGDEKTVLDGIRAILPLLKYRDNHEIPDEPGVCLQNGFIPGKGEPSAGEQARIGFKFLEHPHVQILVKSHVPSLSGSGLLEEQSEARVVDHFPERKDLPGKVSGRIRPHPWIIQRVRGGPLTVNGMPGEESLTYFPADDMPGIAHGFSWETPGEVGNPLKPSIRLDMTTGEDQYTLRQRDGEILVQGALGASSLDTENVLKLYETVLKTIRVRPTSGAVSHPPEEVRP